MPTYRIRTSIPWSLSWFKTNLPTLDPSSSKLHSPHSVPDRETTPPVDDACDRASDSVAPKTLSCTSTNYQQCLLHPHVGNCQQTHHRCLYRAPSSATASSLLGTNPYYYPLHLPYTELAQANHFQPVHCASSCISTFYLKYSQSNDYEFPTSITPSHSIYPSYLQEAHRVGALIFNATATPQQPNSLVYPYSDSPTSTLEYAPVDPAYLSGANHVPPPEETTQSLSLGALSSQSNWSTTSAFSQSYATSGSKALPLAAFEEPCSGEGQHNIAVSSSELNVPREWIFHSHRHYFKTPSLKTY